MYSLFLYFKDKRFGARFAALPYLLALLRFLGVTGLAMLLLTPLLKQVDEQVKKPQIVILQDKSQSVLADTKAGGEDYNSAMNRLQSSLSERYDVSTFQFGDEIQSINDTSATDYKTTNISLALQYTYDVFNDQNLGAVILASDGLYNEGKNPMYLNTAFKAPFYTIGLGDTTIRKDLFIKNVLYNKIAYLGDKFNIQVDVQAFNAAGNSTRLTVRKETGGKFTEVAREPIRIDKNQYFITKTLTLEATEPGVTRYRISVSGINEEMSKVNNTQDIYVEVIDSRLKILLLANAPHPDIAAIKQLLSDNKNYEIEVRYADTNDELNNYDFYLFHNLPSRKHNLSSIIPAIDRRKAPRLFMVGAQTNLSQFNNYQNTLDIIGNNSNHNEVQAILNPSFELFNIEDNSKNKIERFAPMMAPFGDYKIGPKTEVLFYQQVRKIDTEYPLVAFSDDNGIKTGVIAAEGIWKWKLYDFLQHQNFDIVNDIVDKTFVYTSVKEDKRRFRASVSKNLYKENENILFDAELYNNAYQLINDPEATLIIKDEDGKNYDYSFSKNNSAYFLDAGRFSEGNYRYTASTTMDGKSLSQSGKFTVQSIQLELFNTTADHGLLKNLSAKYGGSFYDVDDVASLQQALTTGDNEIKPTVYATTTTKPIIHFKWIFGLLFFFIIVEWFLRRYFGHY